jgi:nucleoside-diphosphate-sugar epimerase
MRKKILLTGASGFIGSNTAEYLAERHNVISPIRSNSLYKQNVQILRDMGGKIIEGNFYDEVVLKRIFEGGVEVVIHLAAIRGETDVSKEEYNKVNVEATRLLLQYAQKYKASKFIFCSSVGVLGTIPKNIPASTTDAVSPDNLYHHSKWEAENIVRQYHNDSFNTCILRPTITYGENDNGFIPKLISLVRNKRFILPSKSVFIHLLNIRSLRKFIADLVEADKLDGNSYIVADKQPVRLSDLVNKISQAVQNKDYPLFLRVPPFIFSWSRYLLKLTGRSQLLTSLQLISQNWTYDISVTEANLGYQPIDTLESIDSTINNFLTRPFHKPLSPL